MAVQSEPAELRPILVPLVDEEADLRLPLDVADTREAVLVVDRLWLVVERDEELDASAILGVDHEADWKGAWSTLRVDGREHRAARRHEEGEFGRGQYGVGHRPMMRR